MAYSYIKPKASFKLKVRLRRWVWDENLPGWDQIMEEPNPESCPESLGIHRGAERKDQSF